MTKCLELTFQRILGLLRALGVQILSVVLIVQECVELQLANESPD